MQGAQAALNLTTPKSLDRYMPGSVVTISNAMDTDPHGYLQVGEDGGHVAARVRDAGGRESGAEDEHGEEAGHVGRGRPKRAYLQSAIE